MANKEKILLLAMISMLLPGALPDAFADAAEPEKKTKSPASLPKHSTIGNRTTSETNQRSETLSA